MSWIVRDPPSPLVDNSPKLKDESPKSEGNTLAPSPTPEADPPFELFCPSPSPPLRLDIVEEQWSTNPLRIKSIFSTTGTGIQSVTSPACGMGWSFNLDLLATSGGKKVKKGVKKPVRRPKGDINTARMHASLQSSPVGFQPGTISTRVSFRREDCVFAVLNNDQQNLVLKGQSTISLGRCDIPLPLDELFIDVDVTVFLQSGPAEDPQKLSASMTKAIRASLDGDFPVDVKFMLFSRKSEGTSVCRRRPIYASGAILKGRNSFLDSYINGSRDSDDPASFGVCQYPYDEDSDLESDLDEDLPYDISEMTDINAREPQPDPLSRPLSPVNNTELDTVQSIPPGSPSDKMAPVASIFGVDSDSLPSSDIPSQKSLTWSELSGMSDGTRMSEYDKPESPVCDFKVDESRGRAEEYQADKVESQENVSASLPRLALINDVAFRTFRALIVYMYTREVAFIPLKSSGGRSYNAGDACSPKSMYRLAVKAGHEGLKKHAFDNLRS